MDTFVFSELGAANRDTIEDYVIGEKVDLSELLSNVNNANKNLYIQVVDTGDDAVIRIDENVTGTFADNGSADVATLSDHGNAGTSISFIVDGSAFDVDVI